MPLVVNIFSLCILQVYLERITHHEFTGSIFDFLPHYFEGIYGFGGNFAVVGMHLWYLAVLFRLQPGDAAGFHAAEEPHRGARC